MPVRPNAAASNGILDDGLGHFDGAGIKIYSGTQPTTGGAATGGTELASGTAPSPAFAAASGRAAAVASNWTLSVGTTGTAGFLRITKSTAIIDIDIGQGSGSLSLDNTSLVSGGTVTISAGTGVTLPGNDA